MQQFVVESNGYDREANRVDLEFPVRVGPRFEIEAPGLDLGKLRRRGLLPFLETERYNETLLEQSRAALRRHFQERGHYDVAVDLTQEEHDDGVTVRLAIDPGPVSRFEALRFTGNESFAADQLEELMESTPGPALSRPPTSIRYGCPSTIGTTTVDCEVGAPSHSLSSLQAIMSSSVRSHEGPL